MSFIECSIGPIADAACQECDFEGGYPLTRALEMVQAILIAMGVTRKAVVVRAREDVLQNGGLKKLHHSIQHPRTYIETLRHFGRRAAVAHRADALAEYMEDRLARIEAALGPVLSISWPRRMLSIVTSTAFPSTRWMPTGRSASPVGTGGGKNKPAYHRKADVKDTYKPSQKSLFAPYLCWR